MRVSDARVIYHDGFYRDGVGVYEHGTLPWLDLLVRLGETWYGPEREPGDEIDALPLPRAYHWETEGGFGTLPDGEAWWTESDLEGTARLIGPGGQVLVELPLQVLFRGAGGDGGEGTSPEPPPTPT